MEAELSHRHFYEKLDIEKLKELAGDFHIPLPEGIQKQGIIEIFNEWEKQKSENEAVVELKPKQEFIQKEVLKQDDDIRVALQTNNYNTLINNGNLQVKASSRTYSYYVSSATSQQDYLDRPDFDKVDAVLKKDEHTDKAKWHYFFKGAKVITIKNKEGIPVGLIGIIAGLGGMGSTRAIMALENGECFSKRIPYNCIAPFTEGQITIGQITSKFPHHQGLTTDQILGLFIRDFKVSDKSDLIDDTTSLKRELRIAAKKFDSVQMQAEALKKET